MIGYKSVRSLKQSKFYNHDDGDRVQPLRDGSFAILGTPGYNISGEAVQYLTLPGGVQIKWKNAMARGMVW